jgi:hypothetical protein
MSEVVRIYILMETCTHRRYSSCGWVSNSYYNFIIIIRYNIVDFSFYLCAYLVTWFCKLYLPLMVQKDQSQYVR